MHNSPCKETACDWFRWAGTPQYMIVDTSSDWDIRHFLTNRDEFISGLNNLEKQGVITKYREDNNTKLYKILKKPN